MVLSVALDEKGPRDRREGITALDGMQSQRQPSAIETRNLLLRPYEPGDLGDISRILGDRETMRFWPRPYSRDEAAAWIERSLASYSENGFGRFPVFENQTGQMIGDCGILALDLEDRTVHDLGFIFAHHWWGRGLATEAAQAMRDHAFAELGLQRLNAIIPWNHIASQRVAEKVGMRKVSEFLNARNRGIRTYFYKLSRSAWQTLTLPRQGVVDRP